MFSWSYTCCIYLFYHSVNCYGRIETNLARSSRPGAFCKNSIEGNFRIYRIYKEAPVMKFLTCPYRGECGSVETHILAYFVQWLLLISRDRGISRNLSNMFVEALENSRRQTTLSWMFNRVLTTPLNAPEFGKLILSDVR